MRNGKSDIQMAFAFRGQRECGDCGRFFCETDAGTDYIEMEEVRQRGRTLVIRTEDSEWLLLLRLLLAMGQGVIHG
jgi:hypothetical protein